jgi:hypothetical protein
MSEALMREAAVHVAHAARRSVTSALGELLLSPGRVLAPVAPGGPTSP